VLFDIPNLSRLSRTSLQANEGGELRLPDLLGVIMQIVIKQPCHVHGVPRAVGDVVMVATAEARQFISSGHAEEFKTETVEKQTKKVKKVVER
jgi:hypothetical protein